MSPTIPTFLSTAVLAAAVASFLVPNAASAGWAIGVSTLHDFATEEDGRGDLHLDPSALQLSSDGMEIQWEEELDACNPEDDGFLYAVADAYSDVQYSDIELFIASRGFPAWDETTELWGNPENDWQGTTGPTMRVLLLDDNPKESDFTGAWSATPLGATAGLWVWDGTNWGFARKMPSGRAANYAILALNVGNYWELRTGNLDRCPAAETISHEIGHALGFAEARHRNDPAMSVLESPTALPNLWQGISAFERDPDRTMRLGAYTQSLLWHEFWGPGAGQDDWVMQNAVIRADPTQPDNRAVPRSMFQVREINPQHLVYDSTTDSYLDCVTRESPVYFAQYSEVSYASSGCTNTATLQYVLGDSHVVGDHVEINQCSASDMWEYQHDETLVMDNTDLLATGVAVLPSTIGGPVTHELTMEIHPVHAPSEWNPDDNRVRMDVTFYPEGTSDPQCAPSKQVATVPGNDSRYGKVVASTQEVDITTSMWTAVGSPQRLVGLAPRVGHVQLSKWDADGVPVLTTGLSSPLSSGDERFGASLSMDHQWLVVGAPRAVGDDGRAYLYRRSGDAWSLHATLTPQGSGSAGRFGTAVALRRMNVGGVNTTVVAVGEPRWGDGGRISIYTVAAAAAPVRVGGIMSNQLDAEYGAALSMSDDTLLVGAPSMDGAATDSGVVWIYELDPSGASVLDVAVPAGSLVAADGATGDEYGASVSVEGDVIVVGAPGHDLGWQLIMAYLNDSGAAYVYGREIDTLGPWNDQAKLHLEFELGGREAGDRFGASVATFRGNILVGAPKRDIHPSNGSVTANAGAAFLYSPLKTEDFSVRRAFAGLGNDDRSADNRFGASVAFGDRLLFVGAPRADTDGNGDYVGSDVGGVRANPYRTFDWVR